MTDAAEPIACAGLEEVVAVDNPTYHADVDPDALPGPFHEVRPGAVFGRVSDPSGRDGGAVFHGTATKWTLA